LFDSNSKVLLDVIVGNFSFQILSELLQNFLLFILALRMYASYFFKEPVFVVIDVDIESYLFGANLEGHCEILDLLHVSYL